MKVKSELNLGGPAGSSRTLTGAFAPNFVSTWLVETELASVLEEQYFIGQRQGKSWRKCLADIPKIFSQKSRFLAILSNEFGEKLSDSR